MAEVGPGGLHAWLTASSYVWGRDQTAAVIGRKKCRAHRKSSGGGILHRQYRGYKVVVKDRKVVDSSYCIECFVLASTAKRLRCFGDSHYLPYAQHANARRDLCDVSSKVSNRRYRRWLNERLLRELTPPLDASEIESLFAPPPWGEKRGVTPFERITGMGSLSAQDIASWEPFRNNVDMDMQAFLLRQREQNPGVMRKGTDDIHSAAMEAWRRVGRHAREALRRHSLSPLLHVLEGKLLAYLTEQEGLEESTKLILDGEDSFHRLLLHGLSQFHGLSSQTVAASSDSVQSSQIAGPTLVVIKKRNCCKQVLNTRQGPLNLVEFLRDVQHHP